jgi:hypothetical protein
MLLLFFGYVAAAPETPSEGVIRAWTLHDRDLSFTLYERDTAWSLNDRDITWTVDER